VDSAKHMADMGRLSQVACYFPSFADVQGRMTGCDFLNLGDGVGLSHIHGTRGGFCSVDVLHAGKRCERLCGDLLAVHLRKCMLGKTETLSHRRVIESPTCG
jgi:hypothetical protein